MRLLPRRGYKSNDEILAVASDRGQIRLQIRLMAQVTCPAPSGKGKAPNAQYIALHEPMRFFVDVDTPEGVTAIFKQIRRSIAEMQDLLGDQRNEPRIRDTAPQPKRWKGVNHRAKQRSGPYPE